MLKTTSIKLKKEKEKSLQLMINELWVYGKCRVNNVLQFRFSYN